jgi:hypothetical protein
LPNEWKHKIVVTRSNLKFQEQAAFEENVAVTQAGIETCEMSSGDVLSVAFSIQAITDVGAALIAKMPLVFTISWTASTNEYLSKFFLTVGDKDADLVISAPIVSCELLKPSILPLRITNVGKLKRVVKLCFGSGEIQPMMKSREVAFEEGEEGTVIEFGFIPLAVGEHKLSVWAREGDRKIVPLLPLCLSVQKPLEQ